MKRAVVLMMVFMTGFSGCTSVSQSQNLPGLTSPEGMPLRHVNVSKAAVHFGFGSIPMFGNAGIHKAVDTLAEEARKAGVEHLDIVYSSRTNWWFSFPPFTFLFTPVTTSVAGNFLDENGAGRQAASA